MPNYKYLIKKVLEKFFLIFSVEIKLNKINKEKRSRINNLKCINIGAGTFKHPSWINLDLPNEFYDGVRTEKVISYDILDLKPLPFENESLNLIYSSNVIEHTTDKALKNLFEECYKKLKKGGMIRLVCSDAELLYHYYKEGDKEIFSDIKDYNSSPLDTTEKYGRAKAIKNPSIQQLFICNTFRQLGIHHSLGRKKLSDDEIEKIFNEKGMEKAYDYCTSLCDVEIQRKIPEDHINWFTAKKLIKMLKEAGFENVYKSGHKQSLSSFMREKEFDVTTASKSLYVEAKK